MANRVIRISATAVLTAIASVVSVATMRAAGQVDTGFGNGGMVVTDFGGQVDRAAAIVLRPDGSGFYVAGVTDPGAGSHLSIASYNRDGSLDAGFGAEGRVTLFASVTSVGDAALQADGRLVVVGTWGNGTTSRFFTARFLRDGTPDASFASGGIRLGTFGNAINIGNAVAIQGDGRILVGGTVVPPSSPFADQSAFGLVRYTTDGALDPTFGSAASGMVTTDFGAGAFEGITRLALLPGGRILAVGGAPDRTFMARYTQDGTLDTAFGAGGLVGNYSYGEPRAVALQSDGRIVLGGNNGGNLATCGYVQRYHADGSIDYSLRILNQQTQLPDGSIGCTHDTVDAVSALALLPNGKIVVAGQTVNAGNKMQVAAHNPDGSFDSSFSTAGVTIEFGQPAVAAGMVVDGPRVLVAGTVNGDYGVAAVTGPDPRFAVSFTKATFSTTELAGDATIAVRLGAPQQSVVTVEYEASAGTAAAGADFVPTSATLTFQPGETLQTFPVSIVNDALVEGDETVVLALRNASNAVLGAPNPATLVISDNPTLRFSTAQYLAAEVGGARTVTVNLSGPSNVDVTVDYATIAGGTATPNQDYVPVSGTLHVPPGSTSASFDVPILQDSLAEPDETVLLLLSNPRNAGLDPSAANPATLTILGGGSTGIGLTCPSCPRFQVLENAGGLTVSVDASDPLGPPVDVGYATVDGTATAGLDYVAVQGTVRVGGGIQRATFSIPILRDRVYDPNESFFIVMQQPDATTMGPLAIVTILDPAIVVQSFDQSSGRCTLASAIESANQDRAIGGCEKGDGDDLIVVPAGTYTMTSVGSQDAFGHGPNALPIVTTTVDIAGEGAGRTVLVRDPGAPAMRFFQLAVSARLTLRDLTVKGGRADDGGAVAGSVFPLSHVVTTNGVVFEDNVAITEGGVMFGVVLLAESSGFQHNSAGQAGGVLSRVMLDARRSTFTANRAGTDGGVYSGCALNVVLTDSALTGNSAGNDGGALNAQSGCGGTASAVTITDSVFVGNAAGLGSPGGSGGAIAGTSALSIVRTRFLDNTSVDSGGALSGANGTISDSTFSGNESRQGGAIFTNVNGAPLVVRSSTFDGNHAGLRGGALSLAGVQATLANVTVSNNRTDGYGGGLTYDRSTFPLTLSNVTIAGNRAAAGGGGVFAYFFAGPIRLRNSLIASNATATGDRPDVGGETPEPFQSDGFNLIGNAQGITFPAAAGDRIGTPTSPIQPLLAPLAANGGPTATHALMPGSPAIDGGNPAMAGSDPAACELTDQRGHTRPGTGTGGALCDIGAYERDVAAGPELAVGKSASTSIAYVGEPIVYIISAVNNGGAIAPDVVVTDTLPAELTASSATASQGSCTVSAHLVACPIGAIAPGMTATVAVTAIVQAAGVIRNSTLVTSAAQGGAPPEGLAASSDVSVHQPIVVNTTLQSPGGSGDCTLGEAIEAANTDRAVDGCAAGGGRDLILLPAGTYLMTRVGSQDQTPCCGGRLYTNGPNALPLISSEMEIRGAGEDRTFLERDANAPDMRFFQISGPAPLSGVLTLSQMTIRGGRATASGGTGFAEIGVDGGAILGGTVVADHVVFDNNVANGKGGVLSDVCCLGGIGGRLVARNSRFLNNAAGQVGGVIAAGNLEATGSSFSGNHAGVQGGVYHGCGRIAVLDHSTLTGNTASQAGGAIWAGSCGGATGVVTVTDSVLSGNSIDQPGGSGAAGGAIAGTNALLRITRSRFLDNSASFSGGAIDSAAGTIADSVFSRNRAVDGAALYSGSGTLVITGSTFDGNVASRFGGAMVMRDIAGTLTNVTITNNAASHGGGVFYQGSLPLRLNNVTVAANTASTAGGGLWYGLGGADVRLRNSIIALNTAGGGGSADDLAGDGNAFHSDGYNVIGNAAGGPFIPGAGDQGGTAAAPLDPLLGPLQNNAGPVFTRALLPGSPAIDAGSPSLPGTGGDSCDFLDARGVPRPQGPQCDAGAFEVLSSTTVAADLSLTATATPDSAIAGQDVTYTVVVQNLGPSDAHGVNVLVTLPTDIRFVTATTTNGTFTQPDRRVIFSIPLLPVGASVTLTVVTQARSIGDLTFAAIASAIEPDLDASNNGASSSLISQRSPTLDLQRIAPARGGDTGFVFMGAFGSGFVPGMTVELARAGAPTLTGSLTYVDPGGLGLTALFDLRGQPRGRWDFVLTNPGVGSTTLPEAFTIEEGRLPDIYLDVLSRDSVRPGQSITVDFVVGNRGNGDAFGVPINLSVPAAMASILPGFPAPSNPPPPGSLPYDPAALPRTTLTTSAAGEPMATFPLYIPVIRAGARLVYHFSFAIPRTTTDSFFTVESKAFPGMIEAATGAAEVAAAADQQLATLFRTAAIVSGPSAAEPSDFSLNPCSRLGPKPQAAACVLSITNEFLNVLSIHPAVGCLRGIVSSAFQFGIGVCTANATSDTSDKYSSTDTLQSVIATVVGAAASCFENSLTSLNAAMQFYSLVSGAFDIAKNCLDIPIDLSLAKRIAIVRSNDPNEKVGPTGAGPQRFLTNLEPLRYMVFFENTPEATAAAQSVVITDRLDPNLVDLATFSFGAIVFGETTVAMPAGQTDVVKDIDLRPAKNLIVRIHATLDATGLITWEFQSLDPATGVPTTDTLAGFLPPDVNSPEGAGSVMFFVQPRAGLPAGATITNDARIVFDLNDPIDTNAWINTIDNSRPTSAVMPLAAVQDAPSFLVTWSGEDSGSGIRDFTVRVSTDDGPFTDWMVNTAQTSATFEGQRGHQYAFSVTARDYAGNKETAHAAFDTSTSVALLAPTITAAATSAPNAAGWYNTNVTIRFTCVGTSSPIPADACPADQTLSAEGAAVASVAQTVTDAAGNISEPSNVVVVKIDKTPPTLNPAVGPNPVLLNGAATATSGAADALSGLASQSCGAIIATSVGTQSVTCTATDNAGNTTSASASYVVAYNVCLLYAQDKPISPTSTVPIKLRLCDAANVNVSSPRIVPHITGLKKTSGDGALTPKGDFKYDAAIAGYAYTVAMKGLTPGTWALEFVVADDPTVHRAPFVIR